MSPWTDDELAAEWSIVNVLSERIVGFGALTGLAAPTASLLGE